MLRIFEAHFQQKVKNTEPGKKITILITKTCINASINQINGENQQESLIEKKRKIESFQKNYAMSTKHLDKKTGNILL